MIEIIRGEEWPLSLYPDNNEGCMYKLSEYTIIEKCDDGYLLLHTLSWSLFLLTEIEYENILNYEYFKKYKIILDEKIDEHSLAKEIYLKRSTLPSIPTYDKINTFIIYTTNKCNAQCFYCFQKDILKQIHMSSETANDVANFIMEKSNGEIGIQWFGGEPLLNTNVMNQICEILAKHNIKYQSSMITNGLLFNEKNINTAIDLWNMKSVQISIDGINETYNNIKNFKNKNIDGFKTVYKNIENILSLSDIKVMVRINVSYDNFENVKETVKYFHDNFEEYLKNGRLILYTMILFDYLKNDQYSAIKLWEKLDELSEKYVFLQKPFYNKILNHSNLLTCMADKGTTLSISTEGELSTCNHWANENVIGNIYDGITKKDVLKEWFTKDGENIKFCVKNACKYLPICNHYYKCKDLPICSTITDIEIRLSQLKKTMIYTYNEYKKRINQMKNGEE